MKTKPTLRLAATALSLLLLSSCVSPYYDDGPYYGGYGPYYDGYPSYYTPYYAGFFPFYGVYGYRNYYSSDYVVHGDRYRHHSGDHHLQGHSYGDYHGNLGGSALGGRVSQGRSSSQTGTSSPGGGSPLSGRASHSGGSSSGGSASHSRGSSSGGGSALGGRVR